ncbi:MAG: Dam family site-specific DNA-(adenine-N6)-methyltransferase [Herpetosiphonaceae bacterium]|nr:Dam family site-specific DNA-(adenine-N6)-methyltransferase [Herpetosiphonaceae bacterium]
MSCRPRDNDLVQLTPPLKWAGGKRWLLPILIPLWQPYVDRRLVEPFVGSMAVALGLRPERVLLNDTNPHLINFYRQLQQGLVITLEMANARPLYYQYRDRLNHLITTGDSAGPEPASLFYYLNRTGFNGLCRFNGKGLFNVPFGRYKQIRYTVDWTPYKQLFASWEFSQRHFHNLPLAPDDFVYADPPYDVPFTSYSPGGFRWNDQVELAHQLAAHPGPLVVSNQATERVLELYDGLGFRIQIHTAPRMIACTGDRTPAKEMLALKIPA